MASHLSTYTQFRALIFRGLLFSLSPYVVLGALGARIPHSCVCYLYTCLYAYCWCLASDPDKTTVTLRTTATIMMGNIKAGTPPGLALVPIPAQVPTPVAP